LEVFKLLGQGLSTKAITGTLNIGSKTVESHKYNIRRKMKFPSVEALRQYAIGWQRGDPR
jgi:DNA-binding CsgD family transcriptional regulator